MISLTRVKNPLCAALRGVQNHSVNVAKEASIKLCSTIPARMRSGQEIFYKAMTLRICLQINTLGRKHPILMQTNTLSFRTIRMEQVWDIKMVDYNMVIMMTKWLEITNYIKIIAQAILPEWVSKMVCHWTHKAKFKPTSSTPDSNMITIWTKTINHNIQTKNILNL